MLSDNNVTSQHSKLPVQVTYKLHNIINIKLLIICYNINLTRYNNITLTNILLARYTNLSYITCLNNYITYLLCDIITK